MGSVLDVGNGLEDDGWSLLFVNEIWFHLSCLIGVLLKLDY